MDARQIVSDAGSGRLPPIVLVVGSERLFVERAVTALRRACLGEDGQGFNEEIFEGRTASGSRIVDAARTLPMLGGRRFVLVRDVDAMPTPELERIADAFDKPSDSACVVLTAAKLDGRLRFAKRAKELGYWVDAAPLRPQELREFVGDEANRRQLAFQGSALAALIDAIGNDLSAIDDALERLSLYVGEGGKVGPDAVAACVSHVRVESIWKLVDAVGARDRRVALAASGSLLADGEPPLRVLAMIARQLRILSRMRDALNAGASVPDAARSAGAPPFKARELATAARRFDDAHLRRAFTLLAETDVALKGSRRPPDTILQSAILELTR